MASSNNHNKSSSLSSTSSYGPQPAVKFARRTSSGRVVSLSRDDDLDLSSEYNEPNDYVNYTVQMPPTPDNMPNSTQSNPPNHQRNDTADSLNRPNGGRGDDHNLDAATKMTDRRMSIMKSSKSILLRSQTSDFDHNRWLFETKGTYGVGNAFRPKDNESESFPYSHNDFEMSIDDFISKPWKPLSRKTKVAAVILSPYRILVGIRFVVLVLFLSWRVKNPNKDAMWLWGMSVVCEIWFAFSWIHDQLPKLNPINRSTDLAALHEKFEQASPANPLGKSDLPGIDVFVSTADPEKDPPLVTANTILSILAVNYPIEKLCCYISDDGGALLTFEAMAEAINFAQFWVPFFRKHNIEPSNPDSYFSIKGDPTKNKKRPDFVKDRRWIKREYDEFKVKINGLSESIQKRCDAFNKREERKERKIAKEQNLDQPINIAKASWMADGTHWPGTWTFPCPDHKKGDHAGIIQVMSKFPENDPVYGHMDEKSLDFTGIDIRLPLFVYVSREKRHGYDHNKKAGAMNAMVQASAILSNGPFILNLDCDHYIYNSLALREGVCFMMDRSGDRICYIQFPQRFEGIDPSDRYANHNTVFLMATCERSMDYRAQWLFGQIKYPAPHIQAQSDDDEEQPLNIHPDLNLPKKFGNSAMFSDSIPVCEFQARPLMDHKLVKNGRPPDALLAPRPPLDAPTVVEVVAVIACWYEDKTEWGSRIGWIYGSVTEDVVTGYRMHNHGWRSVYCVTKQDAFRGTAPINLTDRLHQVLRWATGSVEIFFSRNNPFLATTRLKFLQRIAYMNVGIYPFTSIFLVLYCFLPAFSLFSGHFIVETLNITFLSYLLIITICITLISLLEVKWSGIALEEWWRNEQFWVIGGSSAHLAVVLQGLLKVIAGIEISFTLTSKSTAEDEDDIYADLYVVKWTSLFIVPLTIMVINVVALVLGFSRTVYSVIPQWNKFFGGAFFSFWVLAHLYPFAKGLLGRKGKLPTIVYVWTGLVTITVSLLWISISPPDDTTSVNSGGGGNIQL
ncbi:hypothetical protein Scep_029704 [Stephania cephalantha]|uniref:Cellulose synthase-like protein D1 n=1 Tax=Stephania cephalantha TaxID=152367 RepID=A0AAP0HCJ9_9MAGN